MAPLRRLLRAALLIHFGISLADGYHHCDTDGPVSKCSGNISSIVNETSISITDLRIIGSSLATIKGDAYLLTAFLYVGCVGLCHVHC